MPLDPATFDALIDTVRRFVAERLRPLEAKVADEDEVPESLVGEMRDMGLFGLSIPEEYGGLGLTMSEEVRVALELVGEGVVLVVVAAPAREHHADRGSGDEAEDVVVAPGLEDGAMAAIVHDPGELHRKKGEREARQRKREVRLESNDGRGRERVTGEDENREDRVEPVGPVEDALRPDLLFQTGVERRTFLDR